MQAIAFEGVRAEAVGVEGASLSYGPSPPQGWVLVRRCRGLRSLGAIEDLVQHVPHAAQQGDFMRRGVPGRRAQNVAKCGDLD